MGAEVGFVGPKRDHRPRHPAARRAHRPAPTRALGATETVLLSAVLAEGKTVLRGAATEPRWSSSRCFLQRMGGAHQLSPDRRIVIEGVPRLRGASRGLAGDRLGGVSPTWWPG